MRFNFTALGIACSLLYLRQLKSTSADDTITTRIYFQSVVIVGTNTPSDIIITEGVSHIRCAMYCSFNPRCSHIVYSGISRSCSVYLTTAGLPSFQTIQHGISSVAIYAETSKLGSACRF